MKDFKTFSILLIIGVLLFMISCAGGTSTGIQPKPMKLDIMVTAADGSPIQTVEVGNAVDRVLTQDQRAGQGLGTLSRLSFMDDAKTILYIKIFSGLSVADVTRLWNDLTWLKINTGIKNVHIFINSPGGDAFSGLALSDIILYFRNTHNFHIEAHANGIIASAAVPVFASCSGRYATKGTIFMVHEAALWKWPGRESASDIRSQNELMITLQNLYIGYLVKPVTKLNRAEWEAKEKATTWFNSNKALEWGLIDYIE